MVKLLDSKAKRRIVEAIREAEGRTTGEIRVHLKGHCGGDILGEAKKIFLRLRMHRTQEKNAVLILVALKDHRFALIGDAGIHERVGESFWEKVRDAMAGYFSRNLMAEGIVAGVGAIGEELGRYFPKASGDINELPDTVTGG